MASSPPPDRMPLLIPLATFVLELHGLDVTGEKYPKPQEGSTAWTRWLSPTPPAACAYMPYTIILFQNTKDFETRFSNISLLFYGLISSHLSRDVSHYFSILQTVILSNVFKSSLLHFDDLRLNVPLLLFPLVYSF